MKPLRAFLEVREKVGNIAVEFKTIRNMSKRVRISNESVNCYGTRILTSGIDLAQYQRNPVLLYMHERGKVVGLVKDLKVEGQDVTGELVFDEATDLSRQLKKQWEFGSVKMVSANLQILELSDDEALLVEGQTRPTVTRSKLYEVSVVDIGGNDDALVLSSSDGNRISLAGDGADTSLLPLLNNTSINPLKTEEEMDKKQIALALGLAETATESEITAKISELKSAQADVVKLQSEITGIKAMQEAVQLAAINQAVDAAIREKRLTATMKDHFVELGKKVGLDSLNTTLSAMQPQMKLSATLHRTDGTQMESDSDFSKFAKLSAVPSNMMEDLVGNHRGEYARLYKAEYGIELS